jgi:hypothetical protein
MICARACLDANFSVLFSSRTRGLAKAGWIFSTRIDDLLSSLSGGGYSLALLFPVFAVFTVSPLALSVSVWLLLAYVVLLRWKKGCCFFCRRSDAGRCVTEGQWKRCRCDTGDIKEMHMMWQVRERRYCGDDLQISVVMSAVIAAAAAAAAAAPARIPVRSLSLLPIS